MLCKIFLNDHDRWEAPEWLARNLAAHLEPSFVLAKTRVGERFSELLAGRAAVVNLSDASPAEMCELLQAAEFSRQIIKRPAKWAEPEAALEFITAYDRFLSLLRQDKRVKGD